jgi:hypothetical protein
MMWSDYFMEAQGYTIKNNVLCHSIKSTILPAKNGCMMAGKARKHVKNMVVFITNKITQKKFTIQHRGAELMWADGNTKSLQCNEFRPFRPVLLNIPRKYDNNVEWKICNPRYFPRLKLKE